MAKHTLILDVPDTLNESIIRITDNSVYIPGIEPECQTLLITVPGFSHSVEIPSASLTPNFDKILTACDLELQTSDCGTIFRRLPDGIYVIHYSVSPNDVVYVQYNYLRVASIMNRYMHILCELNLAACNPSSETEKKLQALANVRMYLEAAKAMVEICHEPKKGMDLFIFAKKLLSKFNCKSCN